MGPEVINLYIENLTKELMEAIKIKILLQTQLEIQQKITADLQEKVDKLEKAAARTNKKKEENTF